MRINANRLISLLVLAIYVVLAAGCATTKSLIEAAKEGDTAAVEALLAKGADVDARDKDGNTPLMYASAESDTGTVKALIAGGANVNAKNVSGSTVLMRAITSDFLHEPEYTATINLLLENSADVNTQDEQGMTALMHAAKGHTGWGTIIMPGGDLLVTGPPAGRATLEQVCLTVVKALLAKEADVNTRDKEGMSALIRAAMVDYSEVGRILIEAGADVNLKNEIGGTALMYAAGSGFIGTVQLLLANGADANVKDNNGWTPLITAAYGGQADVLWVLVERGADVEARDREGMTALMYAARNGHLDVVQALLEVDTDINAKNNGGGTALMLAAWNGHMETTQVLLEAGADLNAKTETGFTSLLLAASSGHTEVAKALLEAGANVNAITIDGKTALMEAATNGHTTIVQALLDTGAEVNMKDHYSQTALMRAAFQGHTAALQALLDADANVNATNENGLTVLMAAASEGHVAAVQTLLEAGAGIAARDQDGRTALMHASDRGHTEVAQLLKKTIKERLKELDETTKESVKSDLEEYLRHRSHFSIGGGIGYFTPMKLMAENFNGGSVRNIRVSFTKYPGIRAASLMAFNDIDYFEAGFHQLYVDLFQLRSELNREIATQYDLDNPDALISGIVFAFGGAPYALSLPKGSSHPLVRLAIPTFIYGIGAYNFRFVDNKTFTKLGETTLTELRRENNTTNLGGFSEFGLNALLFDRVALDVNVRLEQVDRVTMVWHWIISGFIVALTEIGIETVINKLPEKWRWLYLYRIPYEIAYANFYYNHPN